MNKRSFFTLIANFVLLSAVDADSGSFNYLSLGSDWGDTYPTCKDGLQQSPIDFVDSMVTVSQSLSLKGINYQNYETYDTHQLKATGLPATDKGRLLVNYANGTSGLY
jgi:carbonic anhydrase